MKCAFSAADGGHLRRPAQTEWRTSCWRRAGDPHLRLGLRGDEFGDLLGDLFHRLDVVLADRPAYPTPICVCTATRSGAFYQ